jgi:hypothetical protein
VPVPKRSPSLGKRAWRPSLSVVGVLLTVSSCGAPRMPTAEFKYTPIQSRAVHRDLNRELAAIAPNALSSRDLDTKRGGFSVGGMDLSIGLQITTLVQGLMQVQTNLGMNNAGQWTLVATRTQTFPTTGGLTAAGPTSPLVTPNTQNQFVVVAQPGGPTSGGSTPPPGGASTAQTGDPTTTPITTNTSSGSPKGPSAGSTAFTVVAGDPATTQVIQQVTKGSISTVISNQLNNVTVSNQSVLNVTINNAAAISRTLGTIMAANRIGDQVSRH